MKQVLLVLSTFFIVGKLTAQIPQKMSYQAVIRDNNSALVVNTTIGMRISLLANGINGTPVYIETQTPTTNLNGLVSVRIGEGDVEQGLFSDIDWSMGNYFIKTETDLLGGNNYTITGATQLLSVPFAMYADNAGNPGLPGPQGIQGETGPAGPQGIQGETGPAGPQGIQGETGPAGPQGIQGETGPAGPIGLTGAAGPQGIQGETGPAGPVGLTGATGPQGIQGETGPAGPVGLTGATGPQGIQGETGPAGPIGLTGATGPQGIQGETGPAGPVGLTGATGPQGIQGETGPAGPIGLTGATGATGATGPQGIQGETGPIGGADTQILFNNIGTTGGSNNLTWTNNNTLQILGTTVTTNAIITSLGSTGPGIVQTDALGNLSVASNILYGSGTSNFLPKFSTTNTLTNSLLRDNGTSISIGNIPDVKYQFQSNKNQLTANGDGQFSLFGYRTRDSQNDGTGYGVTQVNAATVGYNFWGDVYTHGVAGFNYNDYSRCAGTLGAEVNGAYWGALGYKSASFQNYGVYGSTAYTAGAGYLTSNEQTGIGGGFFGSVVGSMSSGNIIGNISSGELFSNYNRGNTYTTGKNIELVETSENTKQAVYSITSTTSKMYSNGSAQLTSGECFVSFDNAFAMLLGEQPTVTASPNGECNGIFISEVTKDGFKIKELNNGHSNATISWIAVGNRIDARFDEATKLVSSPNFDKNIEQVLFNDSNTDGSGMGIWWDGNTLQFGTIPAHLTTVKRK
jgi:Collagen triple helix repeat (20 copies)